MKKNIVLVISLMYLTACASTSKIPSTDKVTTNQSAFLSDYSKLKKVDVGDDSDLMRYISQDIKLTGYNKVILEPVSYYPAPQHTDMVSKEALSNISNYFNNTISKTAFSNIKVVNKPGINTLRIKMAITELKVEDAKLKAYQYIPIAFVINAVTGGLNDMEVKFQIEAEVVDSLTGEILALAVKSGVGERLTNDKTALTLKNLQPLIDSWALTMKKTMAENSSLI